MKPYKITLEVKTKWSLEVHGNDETEAQTTAESLGFGAIEMGGDFEKVLSIEAVDVELLEPEDEVMYEPNAETLAAMEELEQGEGHTVDSVDELMEELEDDDDQPTQS